jgi:hypothetical protein
MGQAARRCTIVAVANRWSAPMPQPNESTALFFETVPDTGRWGDPASFDRGRGIVCQVICQLMERAGIMGLAEGQRVAIDVAQGQKGPEAVGLRVI